MLAVPYKVQPSIHCYIANALDPDLNQKVQFGVHR